MVHRAETRSWCEWKPPELAKRGEVMWLEREFLGTENVRDITHQPLAARRTHGRRRDQPRSHGPLLATNTCLSKLEVGAAAGPGLYVLPCRHQRDEVCGQAGGSWQVAECPHALRHLFQGSLR